jgi:excisionase family DNA binding protein
MHASYYQGMSLEKLNYSKQETAFLTGLSVHTISRDLRLGRINARKYGRRVLISREEVERISRGLDAQPEEKPAT